VGFRFSAAFRNRSGGVLKKLRQHSAL
jgi:hypothetical protein